MSEDALDRDIIAAIDRRVGARTAIIARDTGETRPKVLKRLRKLEALGRVSREPRYTAVNDIFWITPYVPLSERMKP